MNEFLVTDNAHWLSLWREWPTSDRTWVFAPGEYESIKLTGVQNVTVKAADHANRPIINCKKPDGTLRNQGIWAVDCPGFVADGFVVRGAKENGVQVSGASAYVSSTLRNLTIQDVGSQFSNNDAVKLLHVEDFTLDNIVVEPFAKAWSYGSTGSGVDMVACRNGVIVNCRFTNTLTVKTTGQGVQMKGGTNGVTVSRNRFVGCGRAISFGGGQSGGTQWYLPTPTTLPAPSAFNCLAEKNVIANSGAGLWFQNAQDCAAHDNLVLTPGSHAVMLWHSLDPDIDTFKRLNLRGNVFIHDIAKRDDVIEHAVPQPGDGIDEITYTGNWWYSPTGKHFPLYPGSPMVSGEVYGVNPQVRPDEWPHALPSSAGSLPYPAGDVDPPPVEPPPATANRYRVVGTGIILELEEI